MPTSPATPPRSRRRGLALSALAGGAGVALVIAILAAEAAALGAPPSPRPSRMVGDLVPALVSTRPHALAPCTGAFVPHELPHVSRARGTRTVLFDANGAGLAVADLDGDGRLDVVLADLAGPLTVLWNATVPGGTWAFEAATLPLRGAQAVVAVDVEGNGRLDLVTTQRSGTVARLRNLGERAFVFEPLPGVRAPAYAMAWGDLDGDGRLDLVVASYDAARERESRDGALFGAPGGVVVFLARDEYFEPQRLRDGAQALALLLFDATGDGRQEVVVGHDFHIRDDVFARDPDGTWKLLTPFARTSANTMSLDAGDIANTGRESLFSTDMKPVRRDGATLAAWMPLMQKAYERDLPHDGQRAENALQVPVGAAGSRWSEEATRRGVDASGWSWAGRFGDLDNDGWLDLYVATGMIAEDLLAHLPDGTLREPNVVFRNRGVAAPGSFERITRWGLDDDASGRSVVLADLTGDGRLDVVVNTLGSPARVFENRTCGGRAVTIDLRWPASANAFAVGASVTADVPGLGRPTRAVRAGAGYLSGDPPRLHLGVGDAHAPIALTVRWPDGARSELSLPTGSHAVVTREASSP